MIKYGGKHDKNIRNSNKEIDILKKNEIHYIMEESNFNGFYEKIKTQSNFST